MINDQTVPVQHVGSVQVTATWKEIHDATFLGII
jgi:hypothetical protein